MTATGHFADLLGPSPNGCSQPRFDLGVLGTCGPLDDQPKALT